MIGTAYSSSKSRVQQKHFTTTKKTAQTDLWQVWWDVLFFGTHPDSFLAIREPHNKSFLRLPRKACRILGGKLLPYQGKNDRSNQQGFIVHQALSPFKEKDGTRYIPRTNHKTGEEQQAHDGTDQLERQCRRWRRLSWKQYHHNDADDVLNYQNTKNHFCKALTFELERGQQRKALMMMSSWRHGSIHRLRTGCPYDPSPCMTLWK